MPRLAALTTLSLCGNELRELPQDLVYGDGDGDGDGMEAGGKGGVCVGAVESCVLHAHIARTGAHCARIARATR
jgi:hypothetical protein